MSAPPAKTPAPVVYKDKEIPLVVLGEINDIQMPLAANVADKPQGP